MTFSLSTSSQALGGHAQPIDVPHGLAGGPATRRAGGRLHESKGMQVCSRASIAHDPIEIAARDNLVIGRAHKWADGAQNLVSCADALQDAQERKDQVVMGDSHAAEHSSVRTMFSTCSHIVGVQLTRSALS